MNLYVRSQDRMALANYDLIIIEEYEDKYMFIADHYKNMGIYKSKERALEVLNDIQEYKDKLERAYFLGMEESKFISSTFIMPEE